MEKIYLEIRCTVTVNEENGMIGLFQEDIDEATAAIYCYLSAHVKLAYICREYAGAVIASISPEDTPGADVLSRANLCKAFLEGYCYSRYGRADALTVAPRLRISQTIPEGYQPRFENDDK